MQKQTIYNAGIYVRLSQEDMRTGESLSIENQKLILTKYVKEQGWIISDIYVDDGCREFRWRTVAPHDMTQEFRLPQVEKGHIRIVVDVSESVVVAETYLNSCGVFHLNIRV